MLSDTFFVFHDHIKLGVLTQFMDGVISYIDNSGVVRFYPAELV